MNSSEEGYFIKKKVAILIAAGVVALLIIVGLIAGFAPSRKCPLSESSTRPIVPDQPWLNIRLPTSVIPSHYHLTLQPHLENNYFNGTVYIQLEISTYTKYILLHGYQLDINDETSTFISETKIKVPIKNVFNYAKNEYWVVELDNAVTGRYTLGLQFKGKFTQNIVGFYKSNYTIGNETRYLASSKFQPTYARRAFPCFDEPGIKSQFTIVIIHDSNLEALSNMPIKEKTVYYNNNLTKSTFETSVKMVTYLVCFIVSDFIFEETSVGKIKLRVFASPDKVNQISYALKIATYTMKYYQEYFKIPYPLPKQDMVAIPQYPSGATEHWGLITFRESSLLYDENEASLANRQRVASVVSHEMAHMWFGNLMTLKWWNDLWLNEGFASYMEYKGIMDNKPSWKMLDQFLIQDLQPVLKVDSSNSSHPVIVEVNHPDEITSVFDIISYSKGASAIRMLEDFMGQVEFQNGIHEFLTKYAFDNAITNDLWELLSEYSSYNIKEIMDTWLEQSGFPLVTVIKKDDVYTLKQEKFVPKLIPGGVTEKTSWYIPIEYISNTNQNPVLIWMKPNEMQKNFTISNSEWVKFNWKQMGYFRVHYPDLWMTFKDLLIQNHQVFTAADRSNLLDDAFNLAKLGHLDYNITLDLAMYLTSESEYVPWVTASVELSYLDDILSDSDIYEKYQIYVKGLVLPILKNLTWTDSDPSNKDEYLNSRLRPLVINIACSNGDQGCLDNAEDQFLSWRQGESISPNLRSVVYKYGMKNGTIDDWEFMWQRSQQVSSPQDRSALYNGLASSNNETLLTRYIKIAWEKVKQEDFFSVLQYISFNPSGRSLVWNYVRENWEALVDRFTLNDRTLGRLIPVITGRFSTGERLNEMNNFFRKYPDAGAGKNARKEALDTIINRINWLKTKESEIKSWLLGNIS